LFSFLRIFLLLLFLYPIHHFFTLSAKTKKTFSFDSKDSGIFVYSFFLLFPLLPYLSMQGNSCFSPFLCSFSRLLSIVFISVSFFSFFFCELFTSFLSFLHFLYSDTQSSHPTPSSQKEMKC
jgi:hypothetical protein